ncbi:unnamed protein product, partial [Porites evermanni]
YYLHRLYLSSVWDYFLRNMAAPPRHSKEYGRPVAGSKTEARGKYAGAHISQEVKALCNVILQMGDEQPDGTVTVTFGRLFERYTRISNKVVGMLLRARKQNLVDFEGEMLFQRRDDNVVITLLRMPEDIQNDSDEYWNISAK